MRREGKTIEDLTADLHRPAESVEIRVPILLEDFHDYGEDVMAQLAAFAANHENWSVEPENYEGVRINIPGGWFLLRLSVHDPILPLNIENDVVGTAAKVADEIAHFLTRFDKLDLSGFKK